MSRYISSHLQINNQSPLRRSSRLATIIPASYWISIGYPEVGAQARLNLQLDMKKYCDSKDVATIIKLIPRDSEGDIYLRSYFLKHDDILLPHWQRFANGLSGCNTVKDVRLCGVTLSVSVLDIILPTFQSMDNLTHLSFYVADLGDEGFLRLSSFLKKNTSLKKLYFYREEIDDMSVATSFSDALKNHPTLELISLSQMELNNIILGKVLEGCCRVKELVLRLRWVHKSEGVAVVAEFITSNHPTESLKLHHSNISDNDTLSLVSALKKNTNLKELNLRDNNITGEGEKNLLNALFDPTSMDSIIESNHTCIPYTYYDIHNAASMRQHMSQLHWELYHIHTMYEQLKYSSLSNSESNKQKIRRKVVLALCGVDGSLFDLSLLNDLPLQVMPRVLELIQKHTEIRSVRQARWNTKQLQKDALSRLFHTLRGWELPLLFENLQSPSVKGRRTRKRKRKARR